MQNNKYRIIVILSLSVVLFAIMLNNHKSLPFLLPLVFAHCDTLGGPVIQAAKKALESGDPKPMLIWVQEKDEAEIRKAFEKTLSVRKQSPQAQELADMYFFETLVRIHRAGEGAPYTGLKADEALSPAIKAADEALESGSVDNLVKEVSSAVVNGIRQRFNAVMERKKHVDESIEAGREYVRAYVEYVHYVEKLHSFVAGESVHHGESEGAGAKGHHAH